MRARMSGLGPAYRGDVLLFAATGEVVLVVDSVDYNENLLICRTLACPRSYVTPDLQYISVQSEFVQACERLA